MQYLHWRKILPVIVRRTRRISSRMVTCALHNIVSSPFMARERVKLLSVGSQVPLIMAMALLVLLMVFTLPLVILPSPKYFSQPESSSPNAAVMSSDSLMVSMAIFDIVGVDCG